jgi:CubicO group peptidase (beta-lactamase class C family)
MRFNLKAALCAVLAMPLTAASIQGTRPEEVGLSSERLQRIRDTVQRHIEGHDISGAITLVARRGRVAHWEANGLMDLESSKPMARNALFWIASMSKPITGVAILMLMEEGKVRLNDPISKFLPELKDMASSGESVGDRVFRIAAGAVSGPIRRAGRCRGKIGQTYAPSGRNSLGAL